MDSTHLHEWDRVVSDRRAGSAIGATFRFKLLTGNAVRLMLGSVTDGIILTVKNDSVIGDNMGFPDDGLTSHSGFREQGAPSR